MRTPLYVAFKLYEYYERISSIADTRKCLVCESFWYLVYMPYPYKIYEINEYIHLSLFLCGEAARVAKHFHLLHLFKPREQHVA